MRLSQLSHPQAGQPVLRFRRKMQMKLQSRLFSFLVLCAATFAVTPEAWAKRSPQEAAAKTAGASEADLAAIKQTALDYIEGYYEGNAERMERALHPDLAKRIVYTDPNTGKNKLENMTAPR